MLNYKAYSPSIGDYLGDGTASSRLHDHFEQWVNDTPRHYRLSLVFALFLSLLAMMASFASAQQAIPQDAPQTQTTPNQPTPSAQVEAFEDWRVLCQSADEHTICQMLQSASVTEDGTEAFLLSISPDQDGTTSSAVVTVPIGVYLAHGIEIRVDQRRPFKVLYEVCDRSSGCHAGFKLSGAALSAFKQGLEARVRVWTSNTQAVEFPVSLRGFSAAYSHYKSEISG
jgi:invasion protein IalB